MATSNEINGVGVALAAAGLVVAWAGIRKVPLLDAFRDLATGKLPKPPPAKQWSDVTVDAGQTAGASNVTPIGSVSGAAGSVLAMAQQLAASPAGQAGYCWGGGHTSNPCSARCWDCSGYVSCVLNKLGLLKGSMTTYGFLAWKGATTVPWEQRQAGDIIVDARHMGIAIDRERMLNARCTACGRPGVQVSKYTGRSSYKARRVVGAARSGGGGGSFAPGTVV